MRSSIIVCEDAIMCVRFEYIRSVHDKIVSGNLQKTKNGKKRKFLHEFPSKMV